MIKIAQINRSAKIFLRIAVSNKGSMWPLCKKFGAEGNGVNEIIQTAVKNDVRIEGVSFHVGSQCSNSKNWLDGINRAKKIFTMLEYVGMKPSLLNIGGGFPIQLLETDPNIDELAFVLGHEMAHCLEGHMHRRFKSPVRANFVGRYHRHQGIIRK